MLLSLFGLSVAALAAAQGAPPEPPKQAGAELLTLDRTLTAHSRLVRCLAFGPDGRLASGGQDGLLCLWEPGGKLLRCIDLRPGGA